MFKYRYTINISSKLNTALTNLLTLFYNHNNKNNSLPNYQDRIHVILISNVIFNR